MTRAEGESPHHENANRATTTKKQTPTAPCSSRKKTTAARKREQSDDDEEEEVYVCTSTSSVASRFLQAICIPARTTAGACTQSRNNIALVKASVRIT